MSNISVNITEPKQLLETTPASHNIMLVMMIVTYVKGIK